MATSRSLLLLLSCFLFFSSPSSAQSPSALLLPVSKDAATLQYVTRVNQRTPWLLAKLVVDLGGRFLWLVCDSYYESSTYRPIRCRTAACSLANATACGDCSSGPPRPGCNNDTCGVFPENPITGTSTGGELAGDMLSVPSIAGSGSSLGPYANDASFVFSCAPTSLLRGLAAGVQGMAGFGRANMSLPMQLAAEYAFRRQFTLCLPSTRSDGVILFGDVAPDKYLLPRGTGNATIPLMYTPLMTPPGDEESDDEYFIGVNSIKVNETAVPLNNASLPLSAKISTVSPYTVLETSVYEAVTGAFGAALSGVPRAAPVAPFGLCFNSSDVGSTRVGPAVPAVDLVLQEESVFWRISGANSVVQAGSGGVVCLGFVDGGKNPRTAIVIGGHQLEDNLLQFDLAASRLGFSSSLLFRQTSCANFNFVG